MVYRCGEQWVKHTLDYRQGQVVDIRTYISDDGEQWNYSAHSLLQYAKNYRLSSRADYSIFSDTDSAMVSEKRVNYSVSGATSQTTFNDYLTGLNLVTTQFLPLDTTTQHTTMWMNSGVVNAQMDALYRYSNNALSGLDYTYCQNTGSLLRYRWHFNDVSQLEHRAVLQSFTDGQWIDTLCTTTITAVNGDDILRQIQYRYSDTVLIPLFKAAYQYDANNNVTSCSVSYWVKNHWTNAFRQLSNYTENAILSDVQYQVYQNREWHSVASSTSNFNDDGLLESAQNTAEFWASDDMAAVRYLPLPENLADHFVSASNIQFLYVDADDVYVDFVASPLAKLTIYPNPSPTGVFYVDLPDGVAARYVVYDMSGATLQTGSVQSGVVDLSQLPSGVYVANLFCHNIKYVVKLIIAK